MSEILDAAPPGTGELLGGRYRLIVRVGSGGMGRVYRARDELLGRDVAVKLFHSDDADPVEDRRKISEAKVLASLNHPALVTLFDAHIEQGDRSYLVMELIDGPTLRSRLLSGPLERSDAVSMARELASGLQVVHAAGIVHRDIKPANVMLRPADATGRTFQAVLADFGVAHLTNATRHTSPGTVIGTAAYLAPEQVRGEPPIPASDIYALGLLLIEALTGRHPFGDGPVQETLLARLARQPEVPGSLGYRGKSLLVAMTAHDPAARPTAAEVAERAGDLGSLVAADEADVTVEGIPVSTIPVTVAEVAVGTRSASGRTRILPAQTAAPLPRTRVRWLVAVVIVLALATAVGVHLLVAGLMGRGEEPVPRSLTDVTRTAAPVEDSASTDDGAGTDDGSTTDEAVPPSTETTTDTTTETVSTDPTQTEQPQAPAAPDQTVTEPVAPAPAGPVEQTGPGAGDNPNKGPGNNNGKDKTKGP